MKQKIFVSFFYLLGICFVKNSGNKKHLFKKLYKINSIWYSDCNKDEDDNMQILKEWRVYKEAMRENIWYMIWQTK